jgi:hypothetical protein
MTILPPDFVAMYVIKCLGRAKEPSNGLCIILFVRFLKFLLIDSNPNSNDSDWRRYELVKAREKKFLCFPDKLFNLNVNPRCKYLDCFLYLLCPSIDVRGSIQKPI